MTSRPRLAITSFVFTFVLLAACGGGGSGDDDDTIDAATECSSGTTQCNGNTFQTCTGGSWETTNQCPVLCDNDLGCVVCDPDARFCDDDNVMVCNAVGTGSTTAETCTGDAHCSNGACVDLCASAAENESYIGCEYFAVDLDNAVEVLDHPFPQLPQLFPCSMSYPGSIQTTSIMVCWDGTDSAGLCDPDNTCPGGYTCQLPTAPVCILDAAHSAFAIVVSNPQSFPVEVTLSNGAGTTQTVTVAAGQVSALYPQQMSFPDQSVDRSSLAKLGYRIVADAPIVAYQFNPLNNVDVFSNDGSLLIPRHTWDVEYYVMSWATLTRRDQAPPDLTNDYNSYLTVVAAEDGTMVEVTPSAGVRGNGAIGAIAPGVATTFTLNAFDVLNLEGIADADLTGSRVRSLDDKPVAVFGGHEAIVVVQNPAPNPSLPRGPCCADHVEDSMFPTSTWGKTFAIARSQVRNADADHLRIMGQRAGTAVTFMPAPTMVSGNCGALDAGQFCEVKITADTAITATEPILVGHYLESTIWTDAIGSTSAGSGDPSMSIAVPAEQFRTDYAILVPSQYAMNFVAIATTATGAVRIDGNDVTAQLQPFGGSYKGGRIAVTAGQHTTACPGTCGIEVMGYSDAVSYLFAGGLDLRQIVVD